MMKFPALPPSWKVVAFTVNLLCGLILSQVLGAFMGEHEYHIVHEIVQISTMWALSFIMVYVGYEFTVDKNELAEYVWDYLIAMTAAGFPWVFVAVWFLATLPLSFSEAFLVARFAAPTSAGILFSMLAGAGLRETWVYDKARILAIFDDLDTILLMIPLKILMIGFKWELLIVIGIMFGLLVVAWRKLHIWKLPYSWQWTMVYAALVTVLCKVVHHVTHYNIDMHSIHIEVLLPAFVIGCVIDTPCAREELHVQQQRTLTRRLSQLSLQTQSSNTIDREGAFIRVEPRTQSQKGDEATNSAPNAEDLMQKQVSDAEQLGKQLERASATLPSAVPNDDRVVTCRINTDCKHDTKVTTIVGSRKGASKDTPHALVNTLVVPTYLEPDAEPMTPTERKNDRTRSKNSQATVTSKGSRLSRHGLDKKQKDQHGDDEEDDWEHYVQTSVSMVFMVLVGLSMPSLVGKNAGDLETDLDPGLIVFHILIVTILMMLGKMFPVVCFREEAPLKARFALCLGMCPRGEVGASIIVISLELGASGPAIIISMAALVINLVMSGGFIGLVKVLLNSLPKEQKEAPPTVVQKPAPSELKVADIP